MKWRRLSSEYLENDWDSLTHINDKCRKEGFRKHCILFRTLKCNPVQQTRIIDIYPILELHVIISIL